VRAVTLSVLLVSDLDVIFSVMFLTTLHQSDDMENSQFFFWVVVVGLVTYSCGIAFVVPKQKFKVVTLLQEQMRNSPNEFRLPDGDLVTLASRVMPKDRINTMTFDQLQGDAEGVSQCATGLANYGLTHIWNACVIKNAKNECEWCHGIPFYRTASFGFLAEPTPRQLGGILNANALYSLCCGALQLAFGTVIMIQGNTSSLVLIPFCISAFSLVLSIFNVAFDFSALLAQIDCEQRMSDKIQRESEKELLKAKEELRADFEAQVRDIKRQMSSMGSAGFVEGQKKENEAMTMFQLKMKDLDDRNVETLRNELIQYRRRVESIRAAMTGKQVSVDAENGGGAIDEYRESAAVLEQQKQEINKMASDAMAAVMKDMVSMSPEAYAEKVDQIQKDRKKRLDVIEYHRKHLFQHAEPDVIEPEVIGSKRSE